MMQTLFSLSWEQRHLSQREQQSFTLSPSASEGGDHIKWRGPASDTPRAALQEEGGQGKSGQPGVGP